MWVDRGAIISQPAFTVTVVDTVGSYSSYSASISANMLAAAQSWAQYFVGVGMIDIQVNIEPTLGNGVLANATSSTSVHPGQIVNGLDVYQWGTISELVSGIDPNGAAPDIIVNVAANYLTSSYWFDPNPFDANHLIPAGSYDAVSIFMHELGHAWGFNGWSDLDTGAHPSSNGVPYGSMFDTWVENNGGTICFTGPTAEQYFGGAVPLAPGSIMHLGIASDLMNPYAFLGTASSISLLDLAIFQTLGRADQSQFSGIDRVTH